METDVQKWTTYVKRPVKGIYMYIWKETCKRDLHKWKETYVYAFMVQTLD